MAKFTIRVLRRNVMSMPASTCMRLASMCSCATTHQQGIHVDRCPTMSDVSIERPWTDMGDPPGATGTQPTTEDDVYDWSGAIQHSQYIVIAEGHSAEACGFIEDREVIWVRNVAREPGQFAFSERDCERVYDALERGTLNGVWHSHPGGHAEPSDHDWLSQPRGIPMFIVALMNDEPALVVRYDDADRP